MYPSHPFLHPLVALPVAPSFPLSSLFIVITRRYPAQLGRWHPYLCALFFLQKELALALFIHSSRTLSSSRSVVYKVDIPFFLCSVVL